MRLNIISLFVIIICQLLLASSEQTSSKPPISIQKEINSEVRKIIPRLRECFVVKENTKPESVKVIVMFDLPKTKGPATNVRLSSKSHLFNEKLRLCVQNVFESIVFPDSVDHQQHRDVEYPLLFNNDVKKK